MFAFEKHFRFLLTTPVIQFMTGLTSDVFTVNLLQCKTRKRYMFRKM